ncbi:substrate-binding periplasmic protein [Undibacterium terreum]|uniref:Solute-binding protein family 3/N-terminal domain-containing protein n=1 Tax=Undibacterium terreum TaxID=1224302 RepID=A0A916U1Y4_9BURK|nr:transporter substrate-binding domain-containing protein [Undibacterium terreum]GGC57656.1 hypothetical protein GCM10011396_00630 [Undibacterium terreum]
MQKVFPIAALILGLSVMTQAWSANLCPPHAVRIALYEAGLFYFDGKGIDREMANELQSRTGCIVEATPLPRARAYFLLEEGHTDIVMAAVVNPKRDQYAFFIPYMQQRFVTVIHMDVPVEKTTLAAFAADPALHFGAVRGVNYGGGRDDWYARMEREQRLELGSGMPNVFRMLKSRRFQALFAVPLQYEKELADAGMSDQVRVVDWFPNEPPAARALAMSRKNFTAEQLKGWTEVVQSMKSDGTIKRILAKYLSAAEASKAVIK